MGSTVQAILLGTAQDAGVPQAGCYCSHCRQARRNPQNQHWVVSLGLVDRAAKESWIIDATPDFKDQLHLLQQFAPDCPLTGILLTHVHMGHYTGLIHMGPEAMNVRQLLVFVSGEVDSFLRENKPWSFLIDHNHIQPYLLHPNTAVALSDNLHVQPLPVPHRAELSDTLAFVIRGLHKSLFYCPDIDGWDEWHVDLRDFIDGMDIALLDAPFFSPNELPNRDISKIRHPLVTDTVARLHGTPCDIRLIHLNHTNPLLVQDSKEFQWLTQQGFKVGRLGESWGL